MFKILYESKRISRHRITVFQIDEQSVLITTDSNLINCIISLSTWNEITTDKDFIRFQPVVDYPSGPPNFILIMFKNEHRRMGQFVLRSQFKSELKDLGYYNNILLKHDVHYNGLSGYNELQNYTIHNNHSICVSRVCSKLFDIYYNTYSLSNKKNMIYLGQKDEVIDTWQKHVHPYVECGDIHISELTLDDKKYIIDHRTNSMTIEKLNKSIT